MKYLHCFLLGQAGLTAAFAPAGHILSTSSHKIDLLQKETLLFSQSSNQEEDDNIKSTSFSDAGNSIIDAQDQERMESMGDFDENPTYQDNDMERMRAAIRARAAEEGLEKSVTSQQYIEEAKARAMNQAANRQASGSLDLSQISSGNEPGSKKSDWDESLPTMMYDPADELNDAEQAEADKIGQLPVWEQAAYEIGQSKWPDFGTVIREVALMTAVVAVTGAIIINWDSALRDLYTDLGMVPRAEDIPGQMEDLNLPDGFTNNMNEDDLAKITDEMNKAGKSAGLSSKSLDTLMESQKNPDL